MHTPVNTWRQVKVEDLFSTNYNIIRVLRYNLLYYVIALLVSAICLTAHKFRDVSLRSFIANVDFTYPWPWGLSRIDLREITLIILCSRTWFRLVCWKFTDISEKRAASFSCLEKSLFWLGYGESTFPPKRLYTSNRLHGTTFYITVFS
jgi:hypothetical protein